MVWFVFVIALLAGALIKGAAMQKAEKAQKEVQLEAQRRQKEAEDFILASGDQEAIKQMMLARANPATYGQVLASSVSGGNSTLNTAVGVMAGVAAGNLVANAVTASAISSALDSAQTDIANSTASSDADFSDLS